MDGHIRKNGIKIPVLKNTVLLKPDTKLMKYVPETIAVPNSSFVADPKDLKHRRLGAPSGQMRI